MVGALLVVALLFYAVLYSGIEELKGTPVGIWQSLTGGTPAPGTDATTARQKIVPGDVLGPNPAGQAVIAAGRRYLGVPYVFGGSTRSGMDCSGFVMRAYADATGYQLPHNAAQIYAGGVKIANPSAGDIYVCSINAQLDHCGLVVGPNDYLDCVGSHGGVSEHPRGPNEAKIVGYVRPAFLVQRHPGPQHGGGPHPRKGG